VTAFREFVPEAPALLEALTDVPVSGPVGPRAMIPSPRGRVGPSQPPLRPSPRPGDSAFSAVANDPVGPGYGLRAREARLAATAQWEEEDARAILHDPGVQQGLRKGYQILTDLDYLFKEHRTRCESARLQLAHVLGQAAKDPERASQLRENLPKLTELLQALQIGTATADMVKSAQQELDYNGITNPTVQGFYNLF
jgi:hypothetical protein